MVATFLFFGVTRSSAQGCCPNLSFEDTTFNNWQGWTGTNMNYTGGTWTPGFTMGPNNCLPSVVAQHSFMLAPGYLDPNCTDPNNSCNPNTCMNTVAPGGGNVSVRLGDANVGSWGSKIRYTMMVDTNCNSGLTYSYAVVLQNPSHAPTDQPGFHVNLYDQNNVLIPGPCGSYNVYADPNDTNFIKSCTYPNGPQYRCWTSVGIDLTAYEGTNVGIEYWTNDCALGGHYGYAYVDATCNKLTLTVAYCPGMTYVILIAPTGYNSYQWFDPNNNPIPSNLGGNNDTLIVNNPSTGTQYTVQMQSIAGCPTTLVATIQYNVIQPVANITNNVCWGGNIGSINIVGTLGFNPYSYWLYQLGNPNPLQSFLNVTPPNTPVTFPGLTAGTYVVHIKDTLGCERYDTIVVTQPPQPPDTLNASVYFCEGDSIATFCGPSGMTNYQWEYINGTPVAGDTTKCLVVCATCKPDQVAPVDTIVGTPHLGDQYYILWSNGGCQRRSVIKLDFAIPVPLFLPDSTANVFSPNNDGHNDMFNPYIGKSHMYDQSGKDILYSSYLNHYAYYAKDFKLEVYNRWGMLVYQSNDLKSGWDGKYNGKDAPEGVYFWVSRYVSRCLNDETPIVSKGFVHLFRGK